MSYEYTGPETGQPIPPQKSKSTRNCCLFAAGGCGCLAIVIAIIIGVSVFVVYNSMSGITASTINTIVIKQALEKYCNEHGSYPPAYTVDENGKPLHSWRVLILPYISSGPNPFDKELTETQDLQELYDSIRLDEPWDSEYNRQFASKMPRCYFNATLKEEGKTNFQMIIGPKCISDGPGSRTAAEVRNNAHAPVVIVEANPSVEWMKPQDVSYTDIEANSFVEPGSQTPGITCPHSFASVPFGLAVILGGEPGLYFNSEKFDNANQRQINANANMLTIDQVRKQSLFDDDIGRAAPVNHEPRQEAEPQPNAAIGDDPFSDETSP